LKILFHMLARERCEESSFAPARDPSLLSDDKTNIFSFL